MYISKLPPHEAIVNRIREMVLHPDITSTDKDIQIAFNKGMLELVHLIQHIVIPPEHVQRVADDMEAIRQQCVKKNRRGLILRDVISNILNQPH